MFVRSDLTWELKQLFLFCQVYCLMKKWISFITFETKIDHYRIPLISAAGTIILLNEILLELFSEQLSTRIKVPPSIDVQRFAKLLHLYSQIKNNTNSAAHLNRSAGHQYFGSLIIDKIRYKLTDTLKNPPFISRTWYDTSHAKVGSSHAGLQWASWQDA